MAISRTEFELLLYPVDDPSSPKRLSSITCNYNLLQIPDAIVRVATGVAIGEKERRHDNVVPVEWLDGKTRLRVAVRTRKTTTRAQAAVDSDTILFEGYPNAPAIGIGVRAGEASLYLQHWMRDLQNSTMLHEYAHPPVASSPLYETITFPGTTGGGLSGGVGLPHRIGLPEDWQDNIHEDVWGRGLQPMLEAFATKTINNAIIDRGLCENVVNAPMPSAASALERIQNGGSNPYTDGKALQLQTSIDPTLNQVLRKQLGHLLGNLNFASFQGQTFWDHILKLAASLYAELIIRPTDAFFVPSLPLAPQFHTDQLIEGDIVSLNWSETRQSAVRGITIIAPEPRSHSGLINEAGRGLGSKTIQAGCYVHSDDSADGRVYTETAPYWLAETIGFAEVNSASIGRRMEGPSGANPPEDRDQPPSFEIGEVFNNFAKLRYLEEVLRYRTAKVVTAFDTRICVGSTIAVSAKSQHVADVLGVDTDVVVGKVVGITHSVDRTGSRANTQLTLQSVVSLSEWESQDYNIGTHPILDGYFTGADFVV